MAKSPMEQLIEAQIPRLRRYARGLLRQGEEADDLVQDCLERAWSRAHQWRPDSDLRAWLFTILHNLYVNRVRKAVRGPAPTLSQETERADPQPSGQERAMGLRDLELGLAALPPEQREVLLMVCLEELSYQQVADILQVPIGTVMSRLHRARERMRRWLEGEENRAALRSVK